MNNFNKVFIIVKKLCGSTGAFSGSNCFAAIAENTNIPQEKVIFILNTLQDLELIKFSENECYIKLTSFGRKQEQLFTDK